VTITLTDNTVICSNSFAADDALSTDYLYQDEPVVTSTNAFQIEGAVGVISEGNSFSQCGIGTKGGLFRLVSTTYTETGSKF
jgi:hypothetical protein